jgi:hypothetical protein
MGGAGMASANLELGRYCPQALRIIAGQFKIASEIFLFFLTWAFTA